MTEARVRLYTCPMAKVDLARRAQIGQEKRARTRAALVAATNSLFALRSIESVTIDEIVAEAGLAKGRRFRPSRRSGFPR